jgi:hypothetical protein
MAWPKLFLGLLLLAPVAADYDDDAHEMCRDIYNIQKPLRIRHGDSAMQWRPGVFYGHTMIAAPFGPNDNRQILLANRRRDGYWKLLSGGSFDSCLQPVPSDFLRPNGKTILGMEVCDDGNTAQAWHFTVVPGNETSYTMHSLSLEACVMANNDGSYGFEKCDDNSERFLVEEDVYASE